MSHRLHISNLHYVQEEGTEQACCSVNSYSIVQTGRCQRHPLKLQYTIAPRFVASDPEPQRQNMGMNLLLWHSRRELILFICKAALKHLATTFFITAALVKSLAI